MNRRWRTAVIILLVALITESAMLIWLVSLLLLRGDSSHATLMPGSEYSTEYTSRIAVLQKGETDL